MKNTKKEGSIRNPRKFYLSILLIFSMMLPVVVQPFSEVNATVIDGWGNSLSWANSNFVNLTNSGSYGVWFTLSGTLDTGNTLEISAMDGSGKTASGVFVSASGGESSGSVLLNFGGTGWLQWPLSFSGLVYSGSTATPVVASGMTLTGTLDTIVPGITLSSTAPSTITWAITVTATTTEVASGFAQGDISTTNATASGFTALNGTGYTFIVTPTVSTGTITVSVGSGTFSDAAWNTNSGSNTLSYTVVAPADTIAPIVTITSHSSGALVSGSPVFSGTATDTGGIASVLVNGATATLWTGTWSKALTNLVGGVNTISVVATDLSGNTGSTSILVDRVSLTSNVTATLSWTTAVSIAFATDLSSTWVVRYGTSSGALNLSATGTSPGTTHSFTLTGLTTNTTYYFAVKWQGGIESSVLSFKTPTVVDVTTATGTVTATSSVFLSGSTATGATFLGSGTLGILSLTSSGSSLSIPFNGLTISSSWGTWDGVIQAPEITGTPINLTLSGYAFTETAYQIGNAHTELIFSGQTVTVSVKIGSSFSGQTVKVFRSTNQGTTYAEIASCVVTGTGDCVFTTNQLSLFAFAVPADTVPNAFSFTTITGTELSTSYVSSAITVAGITGPTAISIVGGAYNINGGAYTTVAGSVNVWDTVTLQATSAAGFSTSTNTTLIIGWVSGIFTLTTKASSGGGGGWGGGGGIGMTIDKCNGLDYSPSYYDGSCGTPSMGWGNLDTGGNIITGVNTGSFNIPPIILTSFADINVRDVVGNWAELYILKLVVRGIVDNVEFFRPDANLTRAEFLKIVINTTGWNVPTQNLYIPFNDVSLSAWYAPYVSLALTKGMITGDRTSFDPNDTISRAEATKILMVSLGVKVNTPTALSFVDLDLESDLTQYIEAAKYLDILSGQIIYGRAIFRPNDDITRSEIAKVVANAFHL